MVDMRFFDYEHLTNERMREVSHGFHTFAHELNDKLPQSAEKTVVLRKLLEAKDAAVRCELPPVKSQFEQ